MLTPTETRMLAKRIQIAKMLLEGYKYQDIRNFIRVTDHTITSVNNQLNFGEGGYRKIVEKLIKIEIKKQQKLEGKKNLLDPGPYAGRKTTEWFVNKIGEKAKNYMKKKSVEKEV